METHFPIFAKPVMCQHCKQYTTTPVWVTKEIGRSTMQHAFCDENHAYKWYIEHLQGDKR